MSLRFCFVVKEGCGFIANQIYSFFHLLFGMFCVAFLPPFFDWILLCWSFRGATKKRVRHWCCVRMWELFFPCIDVKCVVGSMVCHFIGIDRKSISSN